jgi:hypothetical protein
MVERLMGLYVVNKHLVVLLETAESREHRDAHPRARKRYSICCTCRGHRREDGHCMHTRAFLENDIKPEMWRYITAVEMTAPDKPKQSPHRKKVSA